MLRLRTLYIEKCSWIIKTYELDENEESIDFWAWANVEVLRILVGWIGLIFIDEWILEWDRNALKNWENSELEIEREEFWLSEELVKLIHLEFLRLFFGLGCAEF